MGREWEVTVTTRVTKNFPRGLDFESDGTPRETPGPVTDQQG